ncbi:hypothetical protein H0H93_006834 [Arthromyces matolae]|nr:hypothetical protein H0H93_006834 [Arthromyces matolae]
MYTHLYSDHQLSQATKGPTIPPNIHANQPHGTNLIGRPILFAQGQFTGSTIRAELREIQQADLGRKVDRRPLDPPPVVLLRLFQVYDEGSDQEIEKEITNYEDVQILGFICTADLFPVPSAGNAQSKIEGKRKAHVTLPNETSFPFGDASSSSRISPEIYHPLALTPSHAYSPIRPNDSAALTSPSHPLAEYGQQSHMDAGSASVDVVHYFDDYPICESSKMTSALVGATFVQPVVLDYQGKKAIMFAFSDLAVKVEGSFILRYRFFDIFSKPSNQENLAVQAECYGGRFRIYSTKEFPGLQASTDLTKVGAILLDGVSDSIPERRSEDEERKVITRAKAQTSIQLGLKRGNALLLAVQMMMDLRATDNE